MGRVCNGSLTRHDNATGVGCYFSFIGQPSSGSREV